MSRRYRIKLHNQKANELKYINRFFTICRIVVCSLIIALAVWFIIGNYQIYVENPIAAMILMVFVLFGLSFWFFQTLIYFNKKEEKMISKTKKWYKDKYKI